MNKKTLSFTLGTALASSLLASAPSLQAGENPFAMAHIDTAQQLAAADETTGEAEGKMKEGKCGGSKMKVKEGSCGAVPKAETDEKTSENGPSDSAKQ